jgi:antitoxin component of RelBE/YafQ-DinJ toxin-antitoxin module
MSKLLQLRMSEEQFKKLREKAEKLGLTVSSYVRMLIKIAENKED